MATFTIQELTSEFKRHFDISEVHESFNGGQKNVYIVTCKGCKYALKIFLNYKEREIRELEIYNEFTHLPNIPKIESVTDFENNKVVFETYIEGKNLDSLNSYFLKDATKVRRLIIEIATILKPFWERVPSIIHRDIKPSNIILSPDGQANLIDFGIARILGEESITDTGAPQPGSWRFAAPEQYFHKKELISYRTDFFSIAVLAYFLFYGRLPFGDTIQEIATSYSSPSLKRKIIEDCTFNNLFDNCFKVPPAERPRNFDNLLKLLE